MDFKIVNNINFDKRPDVLDDIRRRDYNPFLINRALSYFPDTVLQANAMNQRTHLDKQSQYDYLLNAVRKRKRFSKWHKRVNLDLVPIIADILNCSPREAELYANMISQEMSHELRGVYGGSNHK